jgi:hypothetical protein
MTRREHVDLLQYIAVAIEIITGKIVKLFCLVSSRPQLGPLFNQIYFNHHVTRKWRVRPWAGGDHKMDDAQRALFDCLNRLWTLAPFGSFDFT